MATPWDNLREQPPTKPPIRPGRWNGYGQGSSPVELRKIDNATRTVQLLCDSSHKMGDGGYYDAYELRLLAQFCHELADQLDMNEEK